MKKVTEYGLSAIERTVEKIWKNDPHNGMKIWDSVDASYERLLDGEIANKKFATIEEAMWYLIKA